MIRIGAVALLVLAAGCISLPEDPTDPSAPREPATGGSMTAAETSSDKTALCTEGVSIDADRFCAERVIEIDGAISGFDLFDVALETFNGDVTIAGASGDAWSAKVTLKARGATEQAASAAIDEIEFRWAHEDENGHFLEIAAEHEGSSEHRLAQIELRMPTAILMRLTAATSNGDIKLDGSPTDGLALTTSNGDVIATGDVTQVALTTSNGEIDATLKPSSSGNWALITSNGDVTLKVPERPEVGYSMEGTTSNGEVDYTLRDGQKGECPQGSEYYTPPCNHRTFESSGYRSRDVRVFAELVTSNGEIDVGLA